MFAWMAALTVASAIDVVEVRIDGSLLLVTPAAYLDQVHLEGDPVVEVRPTGRPGVLHVVGLEAGEAELTVTAGSHDAHPYTYAIRVTQGGGARRMRIDVPVGTFVPFATPASVDYMSTSNGDIASIRSWGQSPDGRPFQLITATRPGRTDLLVLLEGIDKPLYYEVVSDDSAEHTVVRLSGDAWVPLGIPDDTVRPQVSDRRVVQLKRRKGRWMIRARAHEGSASVAAWLPGEDTVWLGHYTVTEVTP